MLKVYDQVLTQLEIAQLLDWFRQEDSLVDDRLDVRSKALVDWNHDTAPVNLLTKILDTVLDKDYEVEVALFYGSRISFRLHTDSGEGDGKPLYKNVLIPLQFEGTATTVLFDNHYHGRHARFGRRPMSPFWYSLPNRFGQLEDVADVRKLLQQCCTDPESVTNFEVNNEFISALEHIIQKRSRTNARRPDDYITDYNSITNYQPDLKFDPETHVKYLTHIPIENLHGLTMDQVVPWVPGQVFTWDRTQLHAAGSGHSYKTGITVLTYLK